MRIGLLDIDGFRSNFPNYAIMKISAFHKAQGDKVDFAIPLLAHEYDIVYKSKIFNYTPDDCYPYQCKIIKGGTGYSLTDVLPNEIDSLNPDYSLYPYIDNKTAYGFLTRGCVNKCKWCVVPIKEGSIKPYRDIEQIAIQGRNKIILMDNNILASDYGLMQIEKIINKGYRVDFNQAMDARLITEDIAQMLAQVKWLTAIRLGCDTPQQITECERAMSLINKYYKTPKQYLLYSMLHGSIEECYNRTSYFRNDKRVRIVAQPFRDYNNPKQIIPQWQNDMARWAMRREIYTSCDFKDYIPRKNFKCSKYFN